MCFGITDKWRFSFAVLITVESVARYVNSMVTTIWNVDAQVMLTVNTFWFQIEFVPRIKKNSNLYAKSFNIYTISLWRTITKDLFDETVAANLIIYPYSVHPPIKALAVRRVAIYIRKKSEYLLELQKIFLLLLCSSSQFSVNFIKLNPIIPHKKLKKNFFFFFVFCRTEEVFLNIYPIYILLLLTIKWYNDYSKVTEA